MQLGWRGSGGGPGLKTNSRGRICPNNPFKQKSNEAVERLTGFVVRGLCVSDAGAACAVSTLQSHKTGGFGKVSPASKFSV
jgi:hypothetical protein